MNLEGANTEAFLRFHRFHERFSASIKIQTMGLSLLADEAESGKAPQVLYQHLSRRGWLWGGMPDWTNPIVRIEDARIEASQGGVVRAFSAFDVFATDLIADLSRWNEFQRRKPVSANDSDIDEEGFRDEAKALYRTFGGSNEKMALFLRPLYGYFRRARNCIAHRDGIASAALVRDRLDPAIERTLNDWKAITGEMNSPELVNVSEGSVIAFTHRQAIATSSMLRLLAWDISQQAINSFGPNGMVYLAARRLFWEEESLMDMSKYTTGSAAISWLLSNRYRVRYIDRHEIQRRLREMDLTRKVSDRFAKQKQRLKSSE